jgi:hypothetical protein
MIIYVDENMSPYLAKGLNLLQLPENKKLKDPIEIRTINDDFGKSAQDEDWIPEAGKKGACIITQDYNIKRIRHQQELCNKFNLGMFYFKPPSKKGYSYWDIVKLLIKTWQEISKIASTEIKPFAYKISAKGKIEKIN